jgi:hypothetical protein
MNSLEVLGYPTIFFLCIKFHFITCGGRGGEGGFR